MTSKLDLIVRKHVLPVLDKEGIEVGLREVSAIARELGYKVSGNRLYRQPSDSEKPVRESHNKLADYIKWYIKTKAAAVAAAESAQPTDPLAPQAGEIKTEASDAPAGSGADVQSVELSPTYSGDIEAHLAAKGLTPEEQEKIDRRRTYLDSFVQNVKGKILSGSLVNLQHYFAEVREQYEVEILSGMDGDAAQKFVEDFAAFAIQRNGERIARQYGDALENILEKDKTGRLAAETARSLPLLYKALTSQSVDKFLTGAVQRIDEYNALPKRKRTKAAWGEVVNYFAVSSTQAMMDRDSLLAEEHPQLLEDLAGVRDNLKQALKDSSNITAEKINEQRRAKLAESEVAALKGDLNNEKSIAGGYKNSSRAFKYLSVVALTVGFVVGGALGRKSSSYEDRQESDRHAHQAEVLKNENIRLNDSLTERTNEVNFRRTQLQETKSTVEQLRQESAYALDLRAALAVKDTPPAMIESIVDRYINERGQGRVVIHASTCQSAMRYLHHLMGGSPQQEDAFVRALKDSDLCKKDIKSANLYIFEL